MRKQLSIFLVVLVIIIIGIAIYWQRADRQDEALFGVSIEKTISEIDHFGVGSLAKFQGTVIENQKPRCREPALCGFPFMRVQVGHGEIRVNYKYDEN